MKDAAATSICFLIVDETWFSCLFLATRTGEVPDDDDGYVPALVEKAATGTCRFVGPLLVRERGGAKTCFWLLLFIFSRRSMEGELRIQHLFNLWATITTGHERHFFEAYRLEYPRARVAGRFVLFDKIYDQFVDDDDVFYYFIFHDLTSRQRRLSATFSFWLCKTGFGFCVSWRRRWPTGPMMIKKTYYFYPRTWQKTHQKKTTTITT